MILMSESKKVWQVLKKKARGFWYRIENCVGSGVPDTEYCIDGAVGKVELKYLKKWPKRDTTLVDINLRPAQINFLKDYAKHGGRGFVLLRVSDDWLLFKGDTDFSPATRSQWIKRALYYDTISPDFNFMIECLQDNYVEGTA